MVLTRLYCKEISDMPNVGSFRFKHPPLLGVLVSYFSNNAA